ncbi:hypothetical protein LTR36_010355 [Oleoguttula mirabilis]|uniref:Uncharacterized protein n=1 Tax=Oleoguttula mirabilis TaxID=1507867 RepID=A0AAV9J4Q2_9PEZI|nr:hypothetical protein LTR36_010355 [Oleoguttula mirabilis]
MATRGNSSPASSPRTPSAQMSSPRSPISSYSPLDTLMQHLRVSGSAATSPGSSTSPPQPPLAHTAGSSVREGLYAARFQPRTLATPFHPNGMYHGPHAANVQPITQPPREPPPTGRLQRIARQQGLARLHTRPAPSLVPQPQPQPPAGTPRARFSSARHRLRDVNEQAVEQLRRTLYEQAYTQGQVELAQQRANAGVRGDLEGMQRHLQHMEQVLERQMNAPGELPLLWSPEEVAPVERYPGVHPSLPLPDHGGLARGGATAPATPAAAQVLLARVDRTWSRISSLDLEAWANEPAEEHNQHPARHSLRRSPGTASGEDNRPLLVEDHGTPSHSVVQSDLSLTPSDFSVHFEQRRMHGGGGETPQSAESAPSPSTLSLAHRVTTGTLVPGPQRLSQVEATHIARAAAYAQYRTDDPEEIPRSPESAVGQDATALSVLPHTPHGGRSDQAVHDQAAPANTTPLAHTPRTPAEAWATQLCNSSFGLPPFTGDGLPRVHGHGHPVAHPAPGEGSHQYIVSPARLPPGTYRLPDLYNIGEAVLRNDTTRPHQHIPPRAGPSSLPHHTPPPSTAASSPVDAWFNLPGSGRSPQDEAFRDIALRAGRPAGDGYAPSLSPIDWDAVDRFRLARSGRSPQDEALRDMAAGSLPWMGGALSAQQRVEARDFEERVRTRLAHAAPPHAADELIVRLRRLDYEGDRRHIIYELAVASLVDFHTVAVFDWRATGDARGRRGLLLLDERGLGEVSAAVSMDGNRAGVLGLERLDQIVGFEIEGAVRGGVIGEGLGADLWEAWVGVGGERMGVDGRGVEEMREDAEWFGRG